MAILTGDFINGKEIAIIDGEKFLVNDQLEIERKVLPHERPTIFW
jgi:hypothetical protein